jgi:hypothetical protein
LVGWMGGGGCKKFVSFSSLYPWGVKYGEFPVGHPDIITEGFEEVSKDSRPYFGLIKCKVLPPRALHHPVLPYFCSGKLMFPLCASCADEAREGFCDHGDADRALSGTWVTTELYKALDVGYRLVGIREVWHYAEREKYDGRDPTTGLFTGYINCFLKLKLESSGWPGWVRTERDRAAFLQECRDREGVELEPGKIEKNPGLRSLAKLCLNSFWGKFGQRSQISDSKFVTDPAEFNRIMFDESNQVEQIRVMSENVVYVTYSKKDAFVEGMPYSNPVVASFVTAICRLRLYSDLERLGERVAYFDTGRGHYAVDFSSSSSCCCRQKIFFLVSRLDHLRHRSGGHLPAEAGLLFRRHDVRVGGVRRRRLHRGVRLRRSEALRLPGAQTRRGHGGADQDPRVHSEPLHGRSSEPGEPETQGVRLRRRSSDLHDGGAASNRQDRRRKAGGD